MRGLDEVEPGQLIECDLDLDAVNGVTAPIAVKEFRKIGVEKVFNPTKIALVPDHYVPNKDIKSARQAKIVRDFRASRYHPLLRGGLHGRACAAPRAGVVGAGDLSSSARTATPAVRNGALGAFATGVGSTGRRCKLRHRQGVVQGALSLCCSRSRAEGWLPASPARTSSSIIGMIGVDGALYQTMGSPAAPSAPWTWTSA